jgi:hypothetical protein
MRAAVAVALVALVAFASAEVLFEEQFGSDWESRWVQSKHKSDLGTFKHSAGKYFNDAEEDKGKKSYLTRPLARSPLCPALCECVENERERDGREREREMGSGGNQLEDV